MAITIIFGNHDTSNAGGTGGYQQNQVSSLDMVAAMTSTWNLDRQFFVGEL